MLLLAIVAGVWAGVPAGLRTAALIFGAVAVFATVSLRSRRCAADRRGRPQTIDGGWQAVRPRRTARSSSSSSTRRARTAPTRRSGCRNSTGATRAWSRRPSNCRSSRRSSSPRPGLRAVVTQRFRQAEDGASATPRIPSASRAGGRAASEPPITKFDGDEPAATLRRLGLVESDAPFVIRFRRKTEGVHMRTFTILIAFSLAAFGQRHKALAEVDAEKPEGKLMQQCHQENDPAKKIALLEAVRHRVSQGRADAVGAGAGPGLLREGQPARPDHCGRRQTAGRRSRRSRKRRSRRSKPRRRRRKWRWSGNTPTLTFDQCAQDRRRRPSPRRRTRSRPGSRRWSMPSRWRSTPTTRCSARPWNRAIPR